jgi:hypothetical protein
MSMNDPSQQDSTLTLPLTTGTPPPPPPTASQSTIQNFNATKAAGAKVPPVAPNSRADQSGGGPNLGAPTSLKKQQSSLQIPASPQKSGEDLTVTNSMTPSITDVPEKLDNFSTETKQVGGLAIAFIILIVLIWMLIPTKSGYTRLQLLWFTLIGRTSITPTVGSSTMTTQNLVDQNPTPPPTVLMSGPMLDSTPMMNGTMNASHLSDSAIFGVLGGF